MTFEQMLTAQGPLAEPWHHRRFVLSYEWVSALAHSSAQVLCLGDAGIFEQCLVRSTGCRLEATGGANDLRTITSQYYAPHFDLVLCMEVIEHVRDQEGGDIATFTGSGIRNMLRFAHDVLKPGGHLFLTTPNVNGWRNLMRWCDNQHPYMYPLHHRELAAEDVYAYLRQAQFSITRYQAVDAWSNHGCTPRDVNRMYAAAQMMGADVRAEVRADDLFFIAQKI